MIQDYGTFRFIRNKGDITKTREIGISDDSDRLALQLKVNEQKMSLEEFDKIIKEHEDNIFITRNDNESYLTRFRVDYCFGTRILGNENTYYNYELVLEEVECVEISELPDNYEWVNFEDVTLLDKHLICLKDYSFGSKTYLSRDEEYLYDLKCEEC